MSVALYMDVHVPQAITDYWAMNSSVGTPKKLASRRAFALLMPWSWLNFGKFR